MAAESKKLRKQESRKAGKRLECAYWNSRIGADTSTGDDYYFTGFPQDIGDILKEILRDWSDLNGRHIGSRNPLIEVQQTR